MTEGPESGTPQVPRRSARTRDSRADRQATAQTEARRVSSPEAARRASFSQLGAGTILILLAVLAFSGSRVAASSQSHAYDPGASPPASYRVTAGKLYQLSTPGGVAATRISGALGNLSCTWTSDGQQLTQLAIASTQTDDRDLLTFATFNAPITGRLSVSCTDASKIFIDDADDSPADHAAPLMLLSVLLAVAGVLLAVTGWYSLGERGPSHYHDAELFDTFGADR